MFLQQNNHNLGSKKLIVNLFHSHQCLDLNVETAKLIGEEAIVMKATKSLEIHSIAQSCKSICFCHNHRSISVFLKKLINFKSQPNTFPAVKVERDCVFNCLKKGKPSVIWCASEERDQIREMEERVMEHSVEFCCSSL